MRLEFTPKVRRGLFQRYALLDDRVSNLLIYKFWCSLL